MAEPKQIKDFIKTFLNNVQENTLSDDMVIMSEWPEIVGETVAQNTKIIRIDKGTLIVGAESSVWLYELRTRYYYKILKAIEKRVGKGKIKKIRFTIGTM